MVNGDVSKEFSITNASNDSECVVSIKLKTLKKIEFTLFSRVLRDSTTHFVRPFVGPSVTLYFFGVFAVFGLTAPAQMME